MHGRNDLVGKVFLGDAGAHAGKFARENWGTMDFLHVVLNVIGHNIRIRCNPVVFIVLFATSFVFGFQNVYSQTEYATHSGLCPSERT